MRCPPSSRLYSAATSLKNDVLLGCSKSISSSLEVVSRSGQSKTSNFGDSLLRNAYAMNAATSCSRTLLDRASSSIGLLRLCSMSTSSACSARACGKLAQVRLLTMALELDHAPSLSLACFYEAAAKEHVLFKFVQGLLGVRLTLVEALGCGRRFSTSRGQRRLGSCQMLSYKPLRFSVLL